MVPLRALIRPDEEGGGGGGGRDTPGLKRKSRDCSGTYTKSIDLSFEILFS